MFVYNFVDMLSHARTDMAMVLNWPLMNRLSFDHQAWFIPSPLIDILKNIAEKTSGNHTTDHGTLRVSDPSNNGYQAVTQFRYKKVKFSILGDQVIIVKSLNSFLPKAEMCLSLSSQVKINFCLP